MEGLQKQKVFSHVYFCIGGELILIQYTTDTFNL